MSKEFTVKKLKEITEFLGNGICIDAVMDMIKELESEQIIEKYHEMANDLMDST